MSVILFALSALAFAMTEMGARPSGESDREGTPTTDPAPTPFVQREEVRFVTLDLIVDEHAKGGWRRATSLTREQVHILVGREAVVLDLFENWCDASPRMDAPAQSASGGVSGGGPGSLQTSSEPSGEGSDPADRDAPSPTKYVIYFDVQHLTLASRASAFKAAKEWGRDNANADAEAMIVVGGMSLRVARPMLPVRQHLQEDIEAARRDSSQEDPWGQGEWRRLDEIRRLRRISPRAAVALADSYVGMDYDVSLRGLDNLRDVMSLFGAIQGTKNLLLFSETLRLVPGEQYGGSGMNLTSVYPQLADVARQANEKNVRIYTIQAAGLRLPGEPDNEDSLTMLASETGGLSLSNTNRLAMLFDRAEEDASCFYRIGFRMPVRHSGESRSITVRIGDTGRGYRVRFRRSVSDPTREQEETDRLTSAFLAPQSARGFPMELRVARLLDHPLGSRMRLEADVPIHSLLALPAPGSRSAGSRASLLMGGRIVSLLGHAASRPVSLEDSWSAADPMRAPLGFERRTDLLLPATGDRPDHSRVVYTEEFDAPPGDYRMVAVAEDALAGSTSARTLDFEARAASEALGEIGLGIRDPSAVIVTREDFEDGKDGTRHAGRPELRTKRPALPEYLLVAGMSSASAGRPLWLFYPVCEPVETDPSDSHVRPSSKRTVVATAPGKRFGGWVLRRELVCGSDVIPLPPRTVPEGSSGDPCSLVVESLVASLVKAGMCRFEVHLDRPGRPTLSRAREFQASAQPGN